MKKLLAISLCTAALVSGQAIANNPTQIVEDMERERATMVTTIINPELSIVQRSNNIDSKLRRLADMERMVMRDDDVVNTNSAIVRRAFANYDLTFLVHASSATKNHISDHWMTQMGFTTDSITNAAVGRR
jgi:hypothetical protein